jgi:hypothetical protein
MGKKKLVFSSSTFEGKKNLGFFRPRLSRERKTTVFSSRELREQKILGFFRPARCRDKKTEDFVFGK